LYASVVKFHHGDLILITNIDFFAVLNNQEISLAQLNTILVVILPTFLALVVTLFVLINSWFSEVKIDLNSIKQTQADHSRSFARLETLVKFYVTLKRYSLDQTDKLVDEETKKQGEK
jgi:hypothetical protein